MKLIKILIFNQFNFNILFLFFKQFKSDKKKNISALFKLFFTIIIWTKVRVLYYINNWVYTTNHRRIAVNYFWFVILSGIVGMVLATVIRLEFAYPGVGIFAGDSLQYLSLASAHGVIMVFFMIMPLLFGAFANFLIPTQLGVHDVAFPRLNSAAFWFLPAGLIMLAQLVCIDRRYQRMNCFNIREVQSLLKKRFFNDLINNKDFHEFTNYSMIGLRFKTNNLNSLNTNSFLFYNYGIDTSFKIRNFKFNNESSYLSLYPLYFNFSIFKIFNFFLFFFFNFFNFFNFFLLFKIYILNIMSQLWNFHTSSFSSYFYNFFLNIKNLFLYFNLFNFNFFNFNLFNFNFLNFNLFNFNLFNFNYYNFNSIFFNGYFNVFFLNYYSNLIYKPIINNNDFQFYKNLILKRNNLLTAETAQFSKFNFNSYYIYIYTYIQLIYNLPFYILTFIINIFNFKELSILFFNFNNFLITWFIPIIVDDNFFFIFWNNFYTFLLINFNLTNNFNFLNNMFLIIFNFNLFNFNLIFNLFNLNQFAYLSRDPIKFKSMKVRDADTSENFKFLHEENYNNFKYQKFDNPIFKYDYKAGDYFPKLYKEVYNHLFSSIIDLTGGLKQAPWFISNLYSELVQLDFNFFISSFTSFNQLNKLNFIKISNTYPYYNFFFNLKKNEFLFNHRWISLNSLNQKYYKMFNTSSMQQRIYSNWRQLKFTREAWRCKLLLSRHQKTLYKRYLNEDGVFWSIERNAKDLLPGWAMITPFSSRTRFTAIGKVDIGLMGVLLVLNSSIVSSANFLVTYRYLSTLNNRKMRDARSFFTEGVIVASWMMIFANPMLAIGIIMLLSDRHWQTSFFDYSGGGDTVLFQHMFWFFGHPEVYVIVIPVFGFTNTILSFYLRKRISARASLMYSMYTIAFLGFFVWGHHMYMVGLAHTTRMLFSTLTVMISVPAATKLMHWCVTFVNSSFTMELPLICTLTFVFMFVSGGISGMCVAHTGMDVLFHDTFYVIGHFHVMLAGGAMIGSFGAFYFYFVSIFGVKYSRIYAYLNYIYYLVGQMLTVIPMFWLGYAGMPRRVLDYPASMGGWHSVISGGHMLNVAGIIAFFIMIFDSLRQSKAMIRSTFGIGRYNTRLNFYIYEISKLIFIQQKAWTLFKILYNNKNKMINNNFEYYESILFSYKFFKIKK